MKKITLALSSFLLLSCATVHQTLVDITEIERVDIEQEEYVRPQIYVEKFEFSKNSRSIASIAEVEVPELSNRQLYFLSFYKQFLTLGKAIGKDSELKACPSFHNVWLNHKKELHKDVEGLSDSIRLDFVKDNKKLLAKYPVLALPYSKKADLYTKLENNDWNDTDEYLQESLERYWEIEAKELATLCDTGVSPSYYVYENLVNYFKNDKSFHRTSDGLKALLKVPVIANMVILDNLRKANYPNFREANRFDNWLIQRSNLGWFKEYRDGVNYGRKVHLSANY